MANVMEEFWLLREVRLWIVVWLNAVSCMPCKLSECNKNQTLYNVIPQKRHTILFRTSFPLGIRCLQVSGNVSDLNEKRVSE